MVKNKYEIVPFDEIKEGQIYLFKYNESNKLVPCLVVEKRSFCAPDRKGGFSDKETHNLQVRKLKSKDLFTVQQHEMGMWIGCSGPIKTKHLSEEIENIDRKIDRLLSKNKMYKKIIEENNKIWNNDEINSLVQ
jgi:hypothetical protein